LSDSRTHLGLFMTPTRDQLPVKERNPGGIPGERRKPVLEIRDVVERPSSSFSIKIFQVLGCTIRNFQLVALYKGAVVGMDLGSRIRFQITLDQFIKFVPYSNISVFFFR